MTKEQQRCSWCEGDPLDTRYHDTEWGVPVRDDRVLFEFLVLEGAQAGLSWRTILNKRQNYRAAFDRFDYGKIAEYDADRVAALLENPGIVRNRLKVASTISNAQAFIKIQEEFGSFSEYLWDFVADEPIVNHWRHMNEVPASTPESDQLSKSLKRHGFKFVGTTICYAYMQAVGMVNDHLVSCFRHAELS